MGTSTGITRRGLRIAGQPASTQPSATLPPSATLLTTDQGQVIATASGELLAVEA